MYGSICMFLIGLVVALTLAGPSWGQREELPSPVFWTRYPPDANSDAAKHENIIPLIRVWALTAHGSPEKVADAVKDEILRLGLDDGPVAIRLEGLGEECASVPRDPEEATALFLHWCDGLADDSNSEMKPPKGKGLCEQETDDLDVAWWWNTPWMSKGIQEHTDSPDGWINWMDRFIQRYREWQNHGIIPAPTRFFFSVEERPRVFDLSHPRNRGPMSFEACKSDSLGRWDSEVICGYDYDMSDLLQLADDDAHWQETYGGTTYRVADFSPELAWDSWRNRPWAKWYQSLLLQACDAAAWEALFNPIHKEWGNEVLCTNYLTSARTDWATDDRNFYLHGGVWGAPDWDNPDNPAVPYYWLRLCYVGKGDLQSPVLYPAWTAHVQGEVTPKKIWGATMKLARHNVDALVRTILTNDDSWDEPDEIVPRIGCAGAHHPVKACSENAPMGMYCYAVKEGEDRWWYEVTKSNLLEMVAMLRARQIREFVVFHNENKFNYPETEDWDALARVSELAWMFTCDNAPDAEFVDDMCPAVTWVQPDGGGLNYADLHVRFSSEDLKGQAVPSSPATPQYTITATHETTAEGSTKTIVTVQVGGAEQATRGPEPPGLPKGLIVTIEGWLLKSTPDAPSRVPMKVYLVDWSDPTGLKYAQIGKFMLVQRLHGEDHGVYEAHVQSHVSDYINNGSVTIVIRCEHIKKNWAPMIDCVYVTPTDWIGE